MALVEAEGGARRRAAVTVTVPDLTLGISLAAKQHAPGLSSSDDGEHRFGFLKTREIVKIAVVAVGIVRIAVAPGFRRGGNHGDAAPHLADEAGAARGVGGGIKHE